MRARLIALSGVAYLAGTFLVYNHFRTKNLKEERAKLGEQGRKDIFDRLATNYDDKIERDEEKVRIPDLRSKLAQNAAGDVLELAVGTGRNYEFYKANPRISSITSVDYSSRMLEQARAKAEWVYGEKAGRGDGKVQPIHSPVLRFAEASCPSLSVFPDSSFDTVVDTFGLCSMEDPVSSLKEMVRVTRKDGNGKILLLEHGKSDRFWLQWYLNWNEPRHALNWGCSYNKDIISLVEEAGLEVDQTERHYYGTLYYIVARPPPT